MSLLNEILCLYVLILVIVFSVGMAFFKYLEIKYKRLMARFLAESERRYPEK